MTMPSARRCARRSVALVARQGLSRGQAAQVVMHLCDDVAARLYQAQADPDLTWLIQLRAEARLIWAREQHRPTVTSTQQAATEQRWQVNLSEWRQRHQQQGD